MAGGSIVTFNGDDERRLAGMAIERTHAELANIDANEAVFSYE
jgi:hypothetical protein